MFVPFENLSPDARIWVYQCDRPLSDDEIKLIGEGGRDFVNNWEAHGQPLTASIKTFHDHFIVLAVDGREQLPTGCSIDQSVAFIRSLGTKLGVDFFNRTKVALLQEGSVLLKDLNEIRTLIKEGQMAENTDIFDTLIQTKGALDHWIIPVKKSWLGRYFGQTAGNLSS